MTELIKKPVPNKKKGKPKYVYLDKFERVTKDLEERIESRMTDHNDIRIIGIVSVISIILSIISIIITFN